MSFLRITVVGSVALDTVETPHGTAESILGGSALFVGTAASIFAPVEIVAVVGNDFPSEELEFLKKRKVGFEGLEVAKGKTFRWHGRYHENMNIRDTISVDLGVFAGFKPKLPVAAAQAEILMLANIDPKLQRGVLDQMTQPRFVAFDSMNHWITGHRKEVDAVMKKVDLVLLNDEELRLLTEEQSPVEGARKLIKKGPSYVVVKKGEHGAMLFSKDAPPFVCPAYPLAEAKDPTGAGDSFAGGMLGYLAATADFGSLNLRQAVVYAGVTASFTVEEFGVKGLEKLTRPRIEDRFRKFREMTEF